MTEAIKMQKLVVRGYALSLDGFSSASGQSLENPFGNGGLAIMDWAFQTRTMKTMFGQEGGSTGIDDSFLAKGFDNIGANILGRNMFGPVRGPWPDGNLDIISVNSTTSLDLVNTGYTCRDARSVNRCAYTILLLRYYDE